MTLKELDDLWDTRCCLEAVSARLAAHFITDSDLRGLRVLCRRRERAARLRDISSVNQADIAFHRRIVMLSHNTVIQRVVDSTRLLERIFATNDGAHVYEVDVEQSPFGHQQIVDALARRDPSLSEQLLTQHVQAGKHRALQPLDAQSRTPQDRAGGRTKRNSG